MRDRLIKSVFIFSGLLLVHFYSFAQKPLHKPFTEVDSFSVDTDYLLQRTSSHTADTVRNGILFLWDSASTLSAENKETIVRTSRKMLQKGLKVNKDLENYFACIVSEKLSDEQRKRFLQIADSSVMFYPTKYSKAFFSKTRLFLEKELLYEHPFNSLKVEGGTFEFKHTPIDAFILHDQPISEATAEPTKEEWFDHLDEEKDSEESSEDSEGSEDEITEAEEEEEEDPWAMIDDSSDDSSSDEEDPWASFLGNDDSDENDDSTADWSDHSSDWGEEWEGEDHSNVEEYKAPEASEDDKFEDLVKQLIHRNEDDVSHYIPEEPPLPSPSASFLYIRHANLTMASKYDTTMLEDITGSFEFHSDTLIGNGGRFTWENAGLSKDSVFCEIPHYVLNVKTPALEGHHAEFHYLGHVDTVSIGYFEYVSHPLNHNPEKTKYPRFKTYTNDILIHSIDNNIQIRGGLSLEGKNMSSQSFAQGSSRLHVYTDDADSLLFTVKTKETFTIADSIISTPKGQAILYQFGTDSIFHPATKVTYDINNEVATFRKPKGLDKIIPFKLSYYGFDVDVDQIKWDLEADSLSFETLYAPEKNPASFQSMGFFKPELFRRLQGLQKQHPLLSTINYVEKSGETVFLGEDLAKARGLKYEAVKGMLQLMHREGLVYYSEQTDEAIITPKGYFFKDAYFRLNKIKRSDVDYDNIEIFSSIPNGQNAVYDPADSAIVIKGVESFQVSDSLKVRILPDSGEVRLYQGQNMRFGGVMVAGNMIVRGQLFDFDYDQFSVNLAEVDSITFLDENDKQAEFQNHISDTGGTLYISSPENKAGLVKMDDYPTFDADGGGAVQFGHESVLDGAYDERVQFVMDSLSFNGNSAIEDKSFAGTFQSDGIFPDFEEELRLNQEDQSFGFERSTPAEGYDVYKGKGLFKGDIVMDSKGLQGKGQVEYLGSTFRSEDFIFFSDSMLTKGTSAMIESDIHPRVEMESYQMKWLVADDSMIFQTEQGKPFSFYNDQLYFRGTLGLVPDNISGQGEIETDDFYLGSKSFRFNKNDYVASDALFEIKSNDPNLPAMRGTHVRVENNMINKSSVIYADEASNGKLTFPFTHYETDINKADWDQANNKLYMVAEAGKKGQFLSTFQGQDSLYFEGGRAEYDLKEHALKVSEISDVIVDRTEIIPSDSTVTIRQNAKIDEIEDAVILMNVDNKYHRFYNAKVNIYSKNYFEASGKYNYTYVLYTESELFLNRLKIVKTDEDLEARAYGKIDESKPFEFLPGVMYSGDVKLSENHPYMFFKGKARLKLNRTNNPWFNYICQDGDTINPIMVNEQLVETNFNKPLQTGIWVSGKKDLQVPFLEFDNALSKIDPVFTVTGQLQYDHKAESYEIKPVEDFPEEEISDDIYDSNNLLKKYKFGQYEKYLSKEERLEFNGVINLIPPSKLRKKEAVYNLKTVASGHHYYAEDSLSFRMFLGLNIRLDRKVINEMIKDFGVQTDIEADKLIDHKTDYLKNIRQVVGDDEFLSIAEDGMKLYELLSDQLLISEAEMIWSAEYSAFHNIGNVTLDGFFSNPVQQKVISFIEMPKREKNDIAHIFLKSYKGNWYYFEIVKDKISMYSSNALVRELIKGDKKGTVSLANVDNVSAFVNNFQTLYQEEDDEIDMITVEDSAIDNLGEDTEDPIDDLPEDMEDDGDGF
ncbi:hypothetical protein [Sediminitomix flava]|uniref:Uncharacterized protein n=1 Tax=Sediminitomix flava TaxID=379075 RepID=A0A315ZCP4_SEDFL|nr:hypothetical protein [Sediminitomix flava]PWJ43346.1 hypothetical protein BC781_102903 [Sediminitomix flava]